jgi:hypothetical protein
MLSTGIKLLAIGMALLLGGFGIFILSIFSLLPLITYTAIIGASLFIVGLGFTALASTKISFSNSNSA